MTDPTHVASPLRKQPSQTRSLRTLDILLEAAARILETQGEAGLTTNHIAERAGYSIGTLYQYFPSKQAILVALLRRHRERVTRELFALLEAAGRGECPPELALRGYVHRLIEAFGRGRRAERVLVRLGWPLDAPALIRDTMDEGARRLTEALQRLADPSLPPPSPVRAYVLTRALLGAVRSAAVEDSPLLDDPAFEDELVHLVTQLLSRPAAAARG